MSLANLLPSSKKIPLAYSFAAKSESELELSDLCEQLEQVLDHIGPSFRSNSVHRNKLLVVAQHAKNIHILDLFTRTNNRLSIFARVLRIFWNVNSHVESESIGPRGINTFHGTKYEDPI
jgi:hypothetical protein